MPSFCLMFQLYKLLSAEIVTSQLIFLKSVPDWSPAVVCTDRPRPYVDPDCQQVLYGYSSFETCTSSSLSHGEAAP